MMIQTIENICFVLLILSGICLCFIFHYWPDVNMTPPFSPMDILKIVMSAIFVLSSIIDFCLQIVERFT